MRSVLICCTPVHGHVAPLLSVARHLLAAGHRVRFLTGARYRDAVLAAGVDHLPLPSGADYDDTDFDRDFPGRAGLDGVAKMRHDMREIFIRPVPQQIAAVDAALAAEHTDAVLAESVFFGAAAIAARPRATRPLVVNLGIVPVSLTSRHAAPFGLGIPPLAGAAGRLRNMLLNVVARRVVFGPVQRYADRVYAGAARGFVMDWPATTDAIVQFTVPGFEYPRPDRDHLLRFVGPVSRSEATDRPLPEWWDDLSGPRPVVHVTQGTIANLDYGALIRPTIEGLAGDDVLVVVSTGGRDASTLAGPLPANVRVASYLPYDRLLPMTDVMVTNGGYGGVHFALQYGVPLVVAGTTEDKIEVSARVAWAGVGVNLKTDNPTSAAVAGAVHTVLADPDYRKASAAIGAEIASAPGLDGLIDVIESATALER